ncbi:TetR/AcrR family transcriptional regulator [Rhodococcus sp. NPDC077669]|uniref:TetR/AcrR family transcriptional regulator n=1 Tax=Rhodococcus sp. NPDC077669 TaxID=3155174 RepID=UPI0034239F66
MPKIDAPTVAEHRENVEGALLDAARDLLTSKGPESVTPGLIGSAVGLARSSVYKYFPSTKSILVRIVADSFADWNATVRARVSLCDSPDERITAYVHATLDLAAAGAHRIAVLGGEHLNSAESRITLAQHHTEVSEPLRAALFDRGDPAPDLTAALVDGALGRAIDQIDQGRPPAQVRRVTGTFLISALHLATSASSNTQEIKCSPS